jgi:hypothetical protein
LAVKPEGQRQGGRRRGEHSPLPPSWRTQGGAVDAPGSYRRPFSSQSTAADPSAVSASWGRAGSCGRGSTCGRVGSAGRVASCGGAIASAGVELRAGADAGIRFKWRSTKRLGAFAPVMYRALVQINGCHTSGLAFSFFRASGIGSLG